MVIYLVARQHWKKQTKILDNLKTPKLDRWMIYKKTPGNHQSYYQQVYLKELFDLKHTIKLCNYETFEYLQHQL